MSDFPKLVLPRRYEMLEREARERGQTADSIVRQVPAATERLDELLRQVRDGGGGRFELLVGKSGSGKTTFLKTVHLFTKGVTIEEIPGTASLSEIRGMIEQRHVADHATRVYALYDRDNPIVDDAEARAFFEDLRVLFRSDAGRVVILWPITDETAAKRLAELAWDIGRDSVVDISKGTYAFTGVPKEEYYEIANATTQCLNGGSNLEVFGLTEEVAAEPLSASETLAEFYGRLEAVNAETNREYGSILKDRVIPRVWIMVGGDDNKELYQTTATLTQGVECRIDVERLANYLEDPKLDAAYLKAWKARRKNMAYLMRLLDVRVIEIPPNVALAAVRGFGSDLAREPLKQKTSAPAAAADAIEKARFLRFVTGESARAQVPRATPPDTRAEYDRLDRSGASDKELNKALAQAVSYSLDRKGIVAKVIGEKQSLAGSKLQPDVQIAVGDERIICLEPTWRTTGAGSNVQNTLTPGHIQQYVLAKALAYVEDLGL